MPNDRISVSYGLTINLGNYESERIDASYERDLKIGIDEDLQCLDSELDEKFEDAFACEFAKVKALVKAAAATRKR